MPYEMINEQMLEAQNTREMANEQMLKAQNQKEMVNEQMPEDQNSKEMVNEHMLEASNKLGELLSKCTKAETEQHSSLSYKICSK